MPVKKYEMDESKDWEGRYKDLEAHHIEETTSLLAKIKKLEKELDNLYKSPYWS